MFPLLPVEALDREPVNVQKAYVGSPSVFGMAAFDPDASSAEESLRGHVLAPLSEAEAVADSEYEEATAERRAFDRFADRVSDLGPVSATGGGSASRALSVETTTHKMDRVRLAFRETVMSVPHYEGAYGESLVVHAASELSLDLAAALKADTDSALSPAFRRTLLAAVEDAVDQRETLCAVLEDERASLATGRDSLTSLLETVDRSTFPDHRRERVVVRLDDIAGTRQDALRARKPLVHQDGHDLCSHLYRDAPWTYPVLTAVTRFREFLETGPVSD